MVAVSLKKKIFFKQKTAYEMSASLVGSEMCIRDRLWGILIAAAIAVLAAAGGSKYNVLDALNLPRIPIDQGNLTSTGAIALAAGLVASLVGALIGGTLGTRWHRRVDRHVIQEPA